MSYRPLRKESLEIELDNFTESAREASVEYEVVDKESPDKLHEALSGDDDDDAADWKQLMPRGNETAHTDQEDGHYNDYEQVLEIVGFGWFHAFLLTGLGVALASDAVEILSISFILPFLRQEDEFDLANWQSGLLSAIIFLGMLFGSYIWGGFSDITGRRKTLIVSLTVNGTFGGLSSLSPNFYLLLLFRFISGMGSVYFNY